MWLIAARKTDLNCKNNFYFSEIKRHILYYEPVGCYTMLRIYLFAHLLYAYRKKIFCYIRISFHVIKLILQIKTLVIMNKT